jgi:hypothetical protein
MLRPLLVVIALLAPAGSAAAQAGAPAFSCADTVDAALRAYHGTWRVTALFRTGPGAWDTTEATSSFTPDLGGCVLRQDYRGRRYGEAYDYLALWGANGNPAARIQRFFTHSLHGIFDISAGSFVGDTLVLESRLTVQGRPLIQQQRITRPLACGFTQTDRRSTDGGATWTETLRATYERLSPCGDSP